MKYYLKSNEGRMYMFFYLAGLIALGLVIPVFRHTEDPMSIAILGNLAWLLPVIGIVVFRKDAVEASQIDKKNAELAAWLKSKGADPETYRNLPDKNFDFSGYSYVLWLEPKPGIKEPDKYSDFDIASMPLIEFIEEYSSRWGPSAWLCYIPLSNQKCPVIGKKDGSKWKVQLGLDIDKSQPCKLQDGIGEYNLGHFNRRSELTDNDNALLFKKLLWIVTRHRSIENYIATQYALGIAKELEETKDKVAHSPAVGVIREDLLKLPLYCRRYELPERFELTDEDK